MKKILNKIKGIYHYIPKMFRICLLLITILFIFFNADNFKNDFEFIDLLLLINSIAALYYLYKIAILQEILDKISYHYYKNKNIEDENIDKLLYRYISSKLK